MMLGMDERDSTASADAHGEGQAVAARRGLCRQSDASVAATETLPAAGAAARVYDQQFASVLAETGLGEIIGAWKTRQGNVRHFAVSSTFDALRRVSRTCSY